MSSALSSDKAFNEWLIAKGIKPQDLSKSHRALWRAEFDNLPKAQEVKSAPAR